MESSETLLRLGHIRASRRCRSINRSLSLTIRNTPSTRRRHVLPVLLLPVPAILHLRNIRILLDCQMANLPMERRMGLPRKILAIPRPILLYHPRKICQGRDHQRTVRTDDARPTATKHQPTTILRFDQIEPHPLFSGSSRITTPIDSLRTFFAKSKEPQTDLSYEICMERLARQERRSRRT